MPLFNLTPPELIAQIQSWKGFTMTPYRYTRFIPAEVDPTNSRWEVCAAAAMAIAADIRRYDIAPSTAFDDLRNPWMYGMADRLAQRLHTNKGVIKALEAGFNGEDWCHNAKHIPTAVWNPAFRYGQEVRALAIAAGLLKADQYYYCPLSCCQQVREWMGVTLDPSATSR